MPDIDTRVCWEFCPVCGQPDNCGDCTHVLPSAWTIWVAQDGEFPEMLLDELTEEKAEQLVASYLALHENETVWAELSKGHDYYE